MAIFWPGTRLAISINSPLVWAPPLVIVPKVTEGIPMESGILESVELACASTLPS